MTTKRVAIITLLFIAVMCCSIVSAAIPHVNVPTINSITTVDNGVTSNNVGLYKPPVCYECVVPTPPVVYEKVGIDFTIDPLKTSYKYGSTVTLTAYQTSGKTLGSDTTWQWDIPSGAGSGASMTRLNGAIVTTKLDKVGKGTIYIRVRDESNLLNGQAQKSVTVQPRG